MDIDFGRRMVFYFLFATGTNNARLDSAHEGYPCLLLRKKRKQSV